MNQPAFNMLLKAILAGLISFVCIALSPHVPVFGFLLNYLTPIPLLLLGFSMGLHLGFIAVLTTGVLLVISFGFALTIPFVLSTLMPFLLICFAFLKKDARGNFVSTDTILDTLCVWGCIGTLLGLVALDFLGFNPIQAIEKTINIIANATPLLQGQSVSFLVEFFPAIMTASWLIHMLFLSAISQKMLISRNLNLRLVNPFVPPKKHIWDIELVCGIMIVLAGSHFGSPLLKACGNVVIIYSVFPLAAFGFYTLRMIRNYYGLGNFFFYGAVIFAFLLVWPLLFIVLLGFVEPWYGFNDRFSKTNAE